MQWGSGAQHGGSALVGARTLRRWWQCNSAKLAAHKDVGASNGNNNKDKDGGGEEDGNRNEDEVAKKTTTRQRQRI